MEKSALICRKNALIVVIYQLWLSWSIANRAVICQKCCWKSKAVAQLSSAKMTFCKTSQILQKTFNIESFLRKTVNSQACNCTKKGTITGAFLWMYLWEYIFSFLPFCFRENKSSHRNVLWKKKCSCWSYFLIKLQAFCEYLGTIASKKIDICLTIKVLLLRRINLLNNNVNKKKKHVRKFYVRSHVTQEL